MLLFASWRAVNVIAGFFFLGLLLQPLNVPTVSIYAIPTFRLRVESSSPFARLVFERLWVRENVS